MEERLDDLQINGYEIYQDPKRFCFGIDAILLSHFAMVRKNERVLDLGTGTGIIPILMHALSLEDSLPSKNGQFYKKDFSEETKNRRVSYAKEFVGLEIQKESAELARRSVEHNGIDAQVHIVQGDIKNVATLFDSASFQVVTSNPPYMTSQCALLNEYEPKMIARHEVLCNLEDVVFAATKMLAPKGRFYMIHKPARIPEILSLMRQYHIEPKKMRLVHPYLDKEPTMVMVEGLRGGKPELRVMPPLIVYRDKGIYTDEIYEIYGMKRIGNENHTSQV